MPDGSEDIHIQDEELSNDYDTTENPATTGTSNVRNFVTTLDSAHNLILFARELEDTDSLQHLHQLRINYKIQLYKKKTHQTGLMGQSTFIILLLLLK